MYYVYDSYLTPTPEWQRLLLPSGDQSVRATALDGHFIGLVVNLYQIDEVASSGFDGAYTYFASHGFSPGSTLQNWPAVAKQVAERGLAFLPSVGPGYDDEPVRPWNRENTRIRAQGSYYRQGCGGGRTLPVSPRASLPRGSAHQWSRRCERAGCRPRCSFLTAMAVRPRAITITSFNEWHEGTQIERAVPKAASQAFYQDYGDGSPSFYLDLTRELATQWRQEKAG